MDKTSLLTIKNLSFAYPRDNDGTINSIHIDSLNLKEIKDIGVDYIAIISALYTDGSITQNLAKLNTILKG